MSDIAWAAFAIIVMLGYVRWSIVESLEGLRRDAYRPRDALGGDEVLNTLRSIERLLLSMESRQLREAPVEKPE